MTTANDLKELREKCFNAEIFPIEILEWIASKNLWNIWVPKAYGGKEQTLSEGLDTLRKLAKIDGSLGWTVTLCSGANYFIGNLEHEVAHELFIDTEEATCMGGSGAVGGTASKEGEFYIVSGRWPYATGAAYLTHYTLNARLFENKKPLTNSDGSPVIRSFIIPQEKVTLIKDWDSMGLRASSTNSFAIEEVRIDKRFSFSYNEQHLAYPIYKIPFKLFADLTLWVNYIGMAEHFIEATTSMLSKEQLAELKRKVLQANSYITNFTEKVDTLLLNESQISDSFQEEVHQSGVECLRGISMALIKIYPLLGIKGSSTNNQLNQIFRDYFTATQHHNFKGV
ncbi:acyl-CoA dehydrogenase [Flavimarina sp. Hel_I_48]|uniref:acyl-CoA dehydrogenase n=1 Tax=Flavimarina sp. Hel_I_48 TaxID=1392488 RepID=UPI0004DF6FDF|nr:acyl-CoA dehydrogenase [Flavimarina sp. Hel_I_48]